ncbi:hypothetical protein RV11_GL000039 [Enterococcus phoeniculicola]|nr:hypothetical protein RV11_GL000039 [Enterococcus phoeniculicola]
MEEQAVTLTENEQLIRQLKEEKQALNDALYQAYEELKRVKERVSNAEKQTQEWQKRAAEKETALEEAKKAGTIQPLTSNENEELIQTKRQINELMTLNEELKKEVDQSQREIGEVLISAKKQASRTIQEAEIEAKQMIHSAELTLDTISNRAKKIALEVDESRQSVTKIYDELQVKVAQLAKGSLVIESEEG